MGATAASVCSSVETALRSARAAELVWGSRSVHERLAVVRAVRDLVAQHGLELTQLFPEDLQRQASETLTAEVLPFAEACRFLEMEAAHVLRPQICSRRGRPSWLSRVRIEEYREPYGIVLVIGPRNYPFFLPGVQIMQALTAGNAVLVKPGEGGSAVMHQLAVWLSEAGLPEGVFGVLEEGVESAQEAMSLGVDKVVVTGSGSSGKAVLRAAAETLTPVTAELSGDDPFVVLRGADVPRAVAALRFGQRLNMGRTCIAPRRIVVHQSVQGAFTGCGRVTVFDKNEEAITIVNASEFALGATIFGPEQEARKVAQQITAGVVVINDVIVPTADPRLSFGGRKKSGFGKTRGRDGLLEMTVAKSVLVQRARRLRHLEELPREPERLFLAFLAALHRSKRADRWRGWREACKAVWKIVRR